MKVVLADTSEIVLGTAETAATVGIIDYSRRVTDDFGTTTVVPRGFAQRLSVRVAVPTDEVDAVQQALADIRATEAQWVVDGDYEWLSPTGFYRSFDIDVAFPPLSYCTLEIEGLAGTAITADPGGDPAPDGASTLKMLAPVPMTDVRLVSSNITEADEPAWAVGTTYALNARVMRGHSIYQSLVGGNIGSDPATNEEKWVKAGPTNRWAMFDQALGTVSTRTSNIEIKVALAGANTIALLDVVGTVVRVRGSGYDVTKSVRAGTVMFYDLPAGLGTATITISGTGPVSVGTFLHGNLVGLGASEAAPTAGINDYSRKEFDEFGAPVIVERTWTKRMEARALIRSTALDIVANRIAAVRALPVLWIADSAIDSLIVYGFFKDFSIDVGETASKLSLSVEGLSEAPPLALLDLDDLGAVNSATVALYQRSATSPALPTADITYTFATGAVTGLTGGWAVQPQASDGNPLWRTQAHAYSAEPTAVIPFGAFPAPSVFTQDGPQGAAGPPGADGQPTYVWIAYADSADGTVNFSHGEPTGREYIGIAPNKTVSNEGFNPADYTWSRIVGDAGVPGPPGEDGTPRYVWFAYADSADGLTNFTTGAGGTRAYLGLATNKTTATESTNAADYVWSKIQGPPGVQGSQGSQGVQGPPGADGTPRYVWFAYANNATGTSGFTTGNPTTQTYIGIATNKTTATESTDPALYTWSKIAGDAGIQGPAGADGTPRYVWVAYANNATGTSGFTTGTPGSQTYIGIAANQTTATESTNPALYTWSKIKGDAGADGANGAPGADGIVIESTGPTAFAVQCWGGGTPKPNALSAGAGTIRLRKAGVVLASGVTAFSVLSNSGATATINSTTGVYSFTGITGETGIVVLRCTYAGAIYQIALTLTKVRDGLTTNEQSDQAAISGMSSTSYPSPDNEHADIDIVLPPGKTLTVSGNFSYAATDASTFAGKMKVTYQNISTGGPETDLITVTGTTATTVINLIDTDGNGFPEPYPSYTPGAAAGSSTAIANGGTENVLYRFRIYAAKSSGNNTGFGSATVSASY